MRYLPLLLLVGFFLWLPRPAHAVGSCEGDFTGDEFVSLPDVVAMGPSFNKSEGQAGFHPRFDINEDGIVNLSDIIALGPWFNQPCEGGDYVEAWHQTLYTPSDPDYTFIGVNRYNLLTIDTPSFRGCGSDWEDNELATWFDEVEAQGIDVVRLWLFQRFTASGTDYSRFDYLLNLADERNIKVIPVLENHQPHCTEAGEKSESWYDTGYLSPYGNYSLSLKAYTASAVTRYKNDDRIAMWQIMNEAETDDATILREFADDLATDIQAIDANHLVSFGTMGAGQPGAQGEDYQTLHALDSIDICEYHDYGHFDEPIPGDQWNGMQVRLDQCAELDKPIFVGEAGIDLSEEGITEQQRADYMDDKISAFLAAGGTGYLYWSYRDRDGADSLEYDSDDPLADVIASY